MKRIGWRRVAAAAVIGVLGVSAAALMKAVGDIDVPAPHARVPLAAGGVRYEPTASSLNTHPLPAWFDDAKFGIFIHWGLFSIPGFAPNGSFEHVLRTDYDRAMLVHPYAEDYWNAIKDPSTPSAAFHRAHYGSMPYQGFKPLFEQRLRRWDPEAWARIFDEAGARYVVLVAKYHDGFCLWPTGVPNIHEQEWFSTRDLVGELASAVRARGLRFGVYYSGGVDWTFRPRISRTLGDYGFSTPGGDYPAYADRQVRELIARYDPDILWNDISWPTNGESLFRLFADYYSTEPHGVVNDRWSEATIAGLVMRLKPARVLFDALMKQAFIAKPDLLDEIGQQQVPHSDFVTPEYTQFKEIHPKKWEMTRGIGHSFGYNRNERDEDYASSESLLTSFIDAVAKNGNLLLNVGPRGDDMQVPPEQLTRLAAIGRWLRTNGRAIYGTRPWTRADTTTASNEPVRFTRRGDRLFAIVIGRPTGSAITLKNVALAGDGRLLVDGSSVGITVGAGSTVLTFAHPLDGAFAPAIEIGPLP